MIREKLRKLLDLKICLQSKKACGMIVLHS